MKKSICILISALVFTQSGAYARENVYAYNKLVANVLCEQQGMCDFAASFAGHEEEYEDINDYFGGLISAFIDDFDGDGHTELVTVDSKMINIYGAKQRGVDYIDGYSRELIGNYGDSYANIFIKELEGAPYICAETYKQTETGGDYEFEMLYLSREELKSRIKLEQKSDGENKYEAVTVNGISEYSYTLDQGISYSYNNNSYEDYADASKNAFNKIGYNIEDVFVPSVQSDGIYRITKFVDDVELMTYIRATGVRTRRPLVLFEDYSSLRELSVPVDIVTVIVNGEEVVFQNQDPLIIEGRTLVPVRGIFEALGARVNWDGELMEVTAKRGNVDIVMDIGSDIFYVNNIEKKLDVPAQIINDRTLVPVRAISESFGCAVEWDDKTKTVIVSEE